MYSSILLCTQKPWSWQAPFGGQESVDHYPTLVWAEISYHTWKSCRHICPGWPWGGLLICLFFVFFPFCNFFYDSKNSLDFVGSEKEFGLLGVFFWPVSLLKQPVLWRSFEWDIMIRVWFVPDRVKATAFVDLVTTLEYQVSNSTMDSTGTVLKTLTTKAIIALIFEL